MICINCKVDSKSSKRSDLCDHLWLAANIKHCVAEFHNVMKIPVLDKPQIPSNERVLLRCKLITEEYLEFMCSVFNLTREEIGLINFTLNAIMKSKIKIDLPELVDALCDLDYVIEGTRLEFGVNGEPILHEVHRANMAKVGGSKRSDGKQLKPHGWKPPQIEQKLREQGWEK